MTDASIAASSAVEIGRIRSSEAEAKPQARFHGYCGECGTWDAHDRRCLHCGYDFYGESVASPLEG